MALTWLHVSDFHLSTKESYDSNVVFKALVESVKWYREKTEWKPDLIFATGDIAGKGDVAIFQGGEAAPATKYFQLLLDAAGLKRDRLFIVPGNHDVERKKGIGLLRTLETEEEIDEYFKDSPKYHFHKLAAFALWYEGFYKYIPIPRFFPDETTCELIPCEINGLRLELLLMNSTLFCKDASTDNGKLCIGRYCIDQLINQLANNRLKRDLALALVHHPLECLNFKYERFEIKKSLESEIDVLLQGHFHQPMLEHGEILQLTAGAAYYSYGEEKKALYGRFDGSRVTVFPIRYQEKGSPKVWTVDTSLFPRDKDFIKSFPVRSRTSPSSLSSSVTLASDVLTENDYATSYQDTLKAELDHFLPDAIESFSPKVSDVYVSLRLSDTLHTEDRYGPEGEKVNSEQEQSHTPEEVMISLHEKKYRLLLVIGDPGSGKTTLLQHYALCCFQKNRYNDFGFTEPVMVFYFPLRTLIPMGSGYAPLPANIFAWSEGHSLAIPEPFFFESFRQRKTLVLLDGLDEISELEERKSVCDWIRNAMTSFPKATLVVTSRQTGYRKMDKIRIQAPFLRADILDFDPQQKKEFLQQWFKALFRDKSLGAEATALKKADALVTFLSDEQNKSLRQMAGLPLLLQIMALLWHKDENLSPSRSVLYKKILDYLLDYQDEQKKRTPLLAIAEAIKVLSPVAFWMQEKWKSDKIGRGEMKKRLQTELNKLSREQNPPSAEEFCKDMVDRAGLLVEYGKQDYIFRHKSFREYLVAVHLITQVNKVRSLKKLVIHFGEDWWSEPLRYFFGQVDEKSFDAFMNNFFDSVNDDMIQKKKGLLRTIIEETPKENRKIDALCNKLLASSTATRQQVILDCLETIGNPEALLTLERFRSKKHENDERDLFRRTEDVILAFGGIAFKRDTEKSDSGKLLSFRNMNEDNAEYILIPGGSYIYSVTKKIVSVPDLYVAKYPVTNKLYSSFIAFLQAKGPKQAAFRAELHAIAESDKWGDGFSAYLKKGESDLAAFFRSEYDEDRKFGGDDQPVVGITWYAAQAYALWLSQFATKPNFYRLPTEVEWQWAAGGRQGTIGKEVRDYPWADENRKPDSKLLNYNGNVGETTPVGSYPEGATPEGLYDMAGNVWEWTDSWYDSSRSSRVIRGGSWSYAAVHCRSANRLINTPGLRLNNVGFRLVFVP